MTMLSHIFIKFCHYTWLWWVFLYEQECAQKVYLLFLCIRFTKNLYFVIAEGSVFSGLCFLCFLEQSTAAICTFCFGLNYTGWYANSFNYSSELSYMVYWSKAKNILCLWPIFCDICNTYFSYLENLEFEFGFKFWISSRGLVEFWTDAILFGRIRSSCREFGLWTIEPIAIMLDRHPKILRSFSFSKWAILKLAKLMLFND